MKKLRRILSVIIVLFMLGTGISVPSAAATDYEMTKTTVFQTSNLSTNNISFTIDGAWLNVSGRLIYGGLESLWIRVDGETLIDKRVTTSSGEEFSCSLSLKKCTGRSNLSVYALREGEQTYWGYIWENLYINTDGKGSYWIEQNADALNNNAVAESAWLNPGECINTDVPKEIKELSDSIVGKKTSDYNAVYKLYDWVVRNIYFDYDYYYGRSDVLYYTPVEIAEHKRTNCAGYAYILAALFDAQGFPNTVVNTYSLGISTSGVYDVNLHNVKSNHAHNEVFINGRWIVIDPTWDTQNRYENGNYITVSPNGHLYFDISEQMLAVNHFILERQYSSKDNTPSQWARSEVWRAICLGLVPYGLQGSYRENITRAEFCALATALYESVNGGEIADRKKFSDTGDVNIEKMAAIGVIVGVGNNRAAPNSTLTREQAATMLARLSSALGKKLPTHKITFDDNRSISHWAVISVGQVNGAGIMNGVGDNKFSPAGSYTREQSVATMLRLYDYIKK